MTAMKTRPSESSAQASRLPSGTPGLCLRFATLLLVIAATAHAQLPVSGRPVPGMAVFDTLMTNFINSNRITAGVLGISRNGRIEYLRAFGWLVEPGGGGTGVPLPENAMMRTASCVKPVTAAAVRQLASESGLGPAGLDTRVFNNLYAGVGGLLTLTPQPALGDSRSTNITVNHLLLHEGGFDRSIDPPGDVMFKSRTVADALHVLSPPANQDVMAYMLGFPLKWAPGTVSNLTVPDGTNAYSNYGYMVLGEVLQAYAPGGYLSYVQSRIMSPALWIPSTEFQPARSLEADRHPREPRYLSDNTSQSVFGNPVPPVLVPTPYGGFYIEGMLAHGGVIASAQAMIHFANNFHVWYQNGDIGQRIVATNRMHSYAHSGRLDGCNTMLWQRSDGIVFYLALNRTDFGDPADFADVLSGRVNDQLNRPAEFTWPDTTADGFWVKLGSENALVGLGGYDSNYQGFQSALNRVTDGSCLRLRPGSQGWTGTITKQVRLDAPEGVATLGQ